ncbi:hypothetical protein N0M98_32970 [Paenibacillus doosanensis]|uniref:hypothetical protein n=1 Tax=Paenibacillus doosanensis TaxID=1229154 RepID=UPI00217F7009|nr:hypothetical protein [Paenibacillus doosanensis]MCS7464897.1 hypothetical protein [Paenibacillus doosanensis]
MNKNFQAIHYFFKEYLEGINAGGTFSVEELIDLFETSENENIGKSIIEELKMVENEIKLYDWEIDEHILSLYNKYGKNKTKKIIEKLMAKFND